MAKRIATRRELLDRWRGIEEEDDDDHRLPQLKELWFSDAFNYLICLPKENHIWCGSWDIMGPLVETFYNYYKDERQDSPLRILWKRISEEMRQCIQCISQHHQAQEMYSTEYDLNSIGPLLDVLQTLDEERVTQHLRDINARLSREEYVPTRDNAEVVSVMYEVLMFPILMDDQSLFNEFETFIEAIDNVHELALAGHQQFPGVYALFFFKRRVRSVAHRLAGSMGKLRRATDLEPLQPLLKKFIGILESEVSPSTSEVSRPRVQLERVSVWLGIKSLLGYLEPPAFEEGILEHYPIFLDIILNHVSGDTVEFSHAVTCLGLLFEILGCKLWLRSTLSPSVMRNTLLGQCFHTRNEKIHKDIFDLFQPFLQSLEALQDGEHEKQRRHFLYFLLHQVPASSNFSVLIRKKACQIALLIIHRGYKMNPPCPPFECAHMWGPSLVSSLKDSSLHSSLRQPAFDLIQTIIVSDASALVTSMMHYRTPPSTDKGMVIELNDDEDADGLPFAPDVEEKDTSSWTEFSTQFKIAACEYRGWMCIPMLWINVLLEIEPPILPLSFSKAVFWAQSRFSMVEPEISAEMMLPIRDWLSSSAAEISFSFGWKVPTGSDDGGDGKESRNSLKVATMCIPLIKTFNRLTAHFVVQMGQGDLRKQWTWEPRMGDSLILLLIDPNDNVRQIGKCILEQVSSTRGLVSGLKFLCSSGSSLSAIFLGFRHAMKLVQLDSVLLNFQTLQHFFFVLRKLLEEVVSPTPDFPENSSDNINITKFSSQGGFLRQPVIGSFPESNKAKLSDVDLKLREQFSRLLSEISWPSIRKCLLEGKAFLEYSFCQMTCVRILEILPVVFERLHPSFIKLSGDSGTLVESFVDFKWLHDLIDWGKSPLKVIVVYWKRTVISLLNFLKASCTETSASIFRAIENLVSCDAVSMDELTESVSRLSVSLSKETCFSIDQANRRPKAFHSERKYPASDVQHFSVEDRDVQVQGSAVETNRRPKAFHSKYPASDVQHFSIEDRDVQVQGSAVETSKRDMDNVVVLSDDEKEPQISHEEATVSATELRDHMLDDKTVSPKAGNRVSEPIPAEKHVSSFETSKGLVGASQERDVKHSRGLASKKQDSDSSRSKSFFLSASLLKSKGGDSKGKEINSKCSATDHVFSKNKVNLKKSTDETVSFRNVNQTCNKVAPESGHTVLKELVHDSQNDPLELALKSARRPHLVVPKPIISVPKRQVIQLNTPFDNKSGNLHRLEARVKRFKLPSLDDWYRPILELDYFEMVGLTSARETNNRIFSKLKEVPVCFHSPEEYVEIFRPLVLEEFKAQLHSSFLELSSLEEIYCGSLSMLSVERVDDFHLVRFVHDDNDSGSSKSFSENDLVLLTKEPLPKQSHDVHMVGKVERRERDNKRRVSILVIRFYLQNGSSRLNQARKHLIERSKWHAGRIMSITSQLREFQALSSLKDIPLLPVILKPGDDSHGYHKSRDLGLGKLSQSLQQILKSSFNDSQLQAISIAIGSSNLKKESELSLIQGPPGTGKTRTIVAIVSGLLASIQRTCSKDYPNDSMRQGNTTNSRQRISQSTALARAWQDAALARHLNEDADKNLKSQEGSARGRVLICAQSNAAVDELVARISCEGLYGSSGMMYKPYLVRVGNAKTVHPNSLPFFIDTLVDHRVAEEKVNLSHAKTDLVVDSSTALRTSLEKLVDRIRFYEAKRASLRDGNSGLENSFEDETLKDDDDGKEMSDAELGMKLRKLYEQKKQIYKDLSTAQAQERKANEETKALRHKLRKSILREAEIVVTTLSGCGGDLYGVCSESMSSFKFGNPSEHTLFDAVVIDEAAQALEPATLIPLQLLKSSGTKCIMVGDPKQLPVTVLSNVASKYLFQCSMFERLQKAGYPVVMLTKQYRMHPEICRFPSLHFYDGKLLNGGNMSSKSAPFHETAGLGPYVFYDIIDGQELRGKNSGALSLYNEREADAAVELLKYFKKRYPSEFVGGRISVITPYKSQLSLLRSRFSSALGSSVAADMEFNTVDGFQGREVDILILSTVRAAESCALSGINSSSIGFVADVRRMNVALTRAKLSLWVLGNARTLQTNRNWSALVKDAKERDLVISAKMPYYSMFKTVSGKMPAPKDYGNQPRQLKHDATVKDASQHSRKTESNGKESRQRKTKYLGSEDHHSRKTARIESDLLATGDRVQSSDRNGSDEHGSLVKKNLSKLDVGPMISGKHGADDESELKGAGQKKHKLPSPRTGKRKVNYENSGSNLESGDGKKSKELLASKGPKKSSACNEGQRNLEASAPSARDNLKDRDTENGGTAPNQASTHKDLIAKRKQQREAVNAILPSALIPSKKSLPAKRSVYPSSIANGGIKPSKTRKVLPAPSKKSSERPDSSS